MNERPKEKNNLKEKAMITPPKKRPQKPKPTKKPKKSG